jgi:RecG wedge domain
LGNLKEDLPKMQIDPVIEMKYKSSKSNLKNRSNRNDKEKRPHWHDLKKFIDKKRISLTPYALDFFENNIISIEILHDDSNLEKIFFFKLPYFNSLTKAVKTKFYKDVNRTSCKTKCTDLMRDHERIINQIKHEAVITRFKLVNFISKNMNSLRIIAYVIVLAINLLILRSFNKGVLPKKAEDMSVEEL